MIRVPRAVFSSMLILVVAGCLDPYVPPISDKEVQFLVVDGFVNSGNRSAEVKLSFAVPLYAESTYNPLSNASVQIEGEDGTLIPLLETKPGVYTEQALNVANGKKYQLRVKALGNEYLSDPVELKRSPILDSVTWRTDEFGTTIYVDSHDVTDATKFYLWTFTETWEYNAPEYSGYIWDAKNGVMSIRKPNEFIYICYKTVTSTRVLITSTQTNTQDVVADFPLTFIKKGSRRLQRTYSILVQQRALDEQAYNFWKNIQRTTEQVGGLFDAMPGQVSGNIHNVNNPDEQVLGYFAGGEVQEKRIFIDWTELPRDLQVVDNIPCYKDTVWVANLPWYIGGRLNVVSGFGSPNTIGYIITEGKCADCRLTDPGGVLEKPSFWPR